MLAMIKKRWPFVGMGCLAALFAYWFFALRPYLWVSGGSVAAFSLPMNTDLAGRIVHSPSEGAIVQKGSVLFAFDTEQLRAEQKRLQLHIDTLGEQLRAETARMDQSMQRYLTTPQEEYFAAFEEAQGKSEKISFELASIQAEWDALELQVQKRIFRAPFDGFVLNQAAFEGTVVAFGETLCTLCDPSRIWIEAQIPETALSSISLGIPARITLSAFPNKEWKGSLSWIGPMACNHSIPIKISVEDADFPRHLGLSAKVRLKIY